MRTTNSQLSQWETMISDAKASGLSRKAWCEAHGISLRQFYYRCVKVREATASSCLNDVDPATGQEARLCMTADSPVFCEISHVCNTAITSQQRADPDFVPELVLHAGNYQIFVNASTTASTLSMELSVLSREFHQASTP